MSEITATLNINESAQNISILIGSDQPILINYSTDVNFTPLVDSLSRFLDGSEELIFDNIPVSTDAKIQLTINTINAIIENYNETQRKFQSQTGEEQKVQSA